MNVYVYQTAQFGLPFVAFIKPTGVSVVLLENYRYVWVAIGAEVTFDAASNKVHL
ncbi:MAG: hypothetical protein AAFN94_16125 [Pseudomonadota bacterium]